jgi:hypothetical protein
VKEREERRRREIKIGWTNKSDRKDYGRKE